MKRWFDAHLDLAYLAVHGRSMTRALADFSKKRFSGEVGPHPPAAVTLPSLRAGRVLDVLGTVFTEPGGTGPSAYDPANEAEAREAGLRQLRCYHNWVHDAGVRLSNFASLEDTGPDRPEGTWGSYGAKQPTHTEETLRIGILMENADPISAPEDLAWWAQRGVIAIGLTWATGSRYAGGNATDAALTPIGRDMIQAMDELRIVHDCSHLSMNALEELLQRASGPVMASHSNCQALLGGGDQRHLPDDAIREIASRGGVIGVNLFAPFLRLGVANDARPEIADVVRHIDHICEVGGSRACVGLGSDMDGGFPATRLPAGIDRPIDLELIAEALTTSGWSASEVEGFAGDNWRRFFAGVRSPGV